MSPRLQTHVGVGGAAVHGYDAPVVWVVPVTLCPAPTALQPMRVCYETLGLGSVDSVRAPRLVTSIIWLSKKKQHGDSAEHHELSHRADIRFF